MFICEVKMSKHEQFREWLENEFNISESGHDKDAISSILFQFKKLPDVAAEIEKWCIEQEILLQRQDCHITAAHPYKRMLNKLKELSK